MAAPAAKPSASTAPDPRDLLEDLVRDARKSGADAADAVIFESTSLSLSQRLGNPEKLEREESRDLGLRAFVGKRQAIVSTTDISPGMLKELVERVVAMARTVPEDPHCGLADAAELVSDYPKTLDICDPQEPATSVLRERARAAEDAARAVKGIT